MTVTLRSALQRSNVLLRSSRPCWRLWRPASTTATNSTQSPVYLNTLEADGPSSTQNIFTSDSIDPHFNLTLEDWLFRKACSETPLLLIYRNAPCVVIGRNQNPWTEINFAALNAAQIPFIRRRSGGGTVYHDLGNANFSIHLPRKQFDRKATGNLVLRALHALNIDAHLNDRNDFCVGENKVSGSAYKIVNKRAYHHGTMLLSSDLNLLGPVLRPPQNDIVTKGVSSVRSPVANLRLHSEKITYDAFVNAVISEFRKTYNIDTETSVVADTPSIRALDYFKQGIAELKGWEWAFGQTPEFTQTLRRTFAWGEVVATLRSRHGVITDLNFSIENPTTESVSNSFAEVGERYKGRRYNPSADAHADVKAVEDGVVGNGEARDVVAWVDSYVEA